MEKPTVGYIGLGHAGYPMAACLAKKGYKLLVHDLDSTPAKKFVQEFPECRLAASTDETGPLGREAFHSCGIVITMLPNGKVVREALLGENGVAWGLQPGTYARNRHRCKTYCMVDKHGDESHTYIYDPAGSIIVDTSSSSPFDTQMLGQELKNLSLALIDAPITQRALHAIDTGGATLMVGSDDTHALEKVLPVLKDMSSFVFPMGKLGAGHTMKTLNNYVSVGSIIALCDALVCLCRLGWIYRSTSTTPSIFA